MISCVQTIAVAAMFLACKVEEVSKSLETCIREFWDQRYRSRIGRNEDELKAARAKVSDPVRTQQLGTRWPNSLPPHTKQQ